MASGVWRVYRAPRARSETVLRSSSTGVCWALAELCVARMEWRRWADAWCRRRDGSTRYRPAQRGVGAGYAAEHLETESLSVGLLGGQGGETEGEGCGEWIRCAVAGLCWRVIASVDLLRCGVGGVQAG